MHCWFSRFWNRSSILQPILVKIQCAYLKERKKWAKIRQNFSRRYCAPARSCARSALEALFRASVKNRDDGWMPHRKNKFSFGCVICSQKKKNLIAKRIFFFLCPRFRKIKIKQNPRKNQRGRHFSVIRAKATRWGAPWYCIRVWPFSRDGPPRPRDFFSPETLTDWAPFQVDFSVRVF